MAIVTFQAKLYTGIRCWCVDKNISAALSSAFSLGNYDINNPGDVPDLDINGDKIVYPNVYAWRLKRTVADLVVTPQISLTNEKLKTLGAGNVVNDGYFVLGETYKIINIGTNESPNVGDTDWNSISGETRTDVAAVPGVSVARPAWIPGDEFTAQNNGTVPYLNPPAAQDADPNNPDRRNATPKTGKAHLASWTIKSSLTCEFPTYIEFDLEKLNLPEGTDCIVYFEEGFLLEDRGRQLPSGAWEYPDAVQGAPSPKIDNFFQFRTPWYGLSFMTSTFTRNIVPLRIKPLQATISSTGSNLTAYGIYNPGRSAALFGGVFITTPNARKITENILTLYSFTGEGSQIWNNFIPTRIKQLASDLGPSSASLIADFLICILYQANLSSDVLVDIPTVEKFKGIVNQNLSNNVLLDSSPVKTARARSQNNVITSTTSAIIGKIRPLVSTNNNIVTSLSATINHIQRSPRWISASSYSVSGGGEVFPLSGGDYVIASLTAGGTALRRYTGGSLTQDAAGVQYSDRRNMDVGAGGFWVVSNANNAVDWGAWGTSQNPPIYKNVPVVAVCKSSGDKFAIYDSGTAYVQIYNTSGTLLTVYNNIALNIGTPRRMALRSLTSSALFVVTTSASGIRVARYTGTSWQTNNFTAQTDANEIYISSDALTMAVSSNNNDKVYILTRTSTSVGFSLTQTITANYNNVFLDPNKQFLFLDNRSYLLSGSTYTYVRDVGYPTGAGALTFGSNTETTQIISNTAYSYSWQ